MITMIALNPEQARVLHHINDFLWQKPLASPRARMRQHRDSPGGSNQLHSIDGVGCPVHDVILTRRMQSLNKNGTAIRKSAYFNQGIRNMWTPNRSIFRSKSAHLLPRDWVIFCEAFNNFLRARETRLSRSTLHCKQGLVRGIGKVSQKGDPLTRTGQLHPTH